MYGLKPQSGCMQLLLIYLAMLDPIWMKQD
jgi:hypothetical protein